MSTEKTRIWANDWVITLTATLVGVFVALYLNEWMATSKLKYQKTIATKNILAEMDANEEKLLTAIGQHEKLTGIMKFLGEYMNEENELICSVNTLNEFRKEFPGTIVVDDSTFFKEDLYTFNGEINLDLSFTQFELTTISWETLKSSGIGATFGFECLMVLETVFNITKEVLEQNKELLDYLSGTLERGENNENLLNHLRLLLEYENSLKDVYKNSEEELANCN